MSDFPTIDQTAMVRERIKQLRAQPKLGDPHKEPPADVPLNRNPSKHDVVAWRHDGRIDTQRLDTKKAAQEYGRALPWVIYYQYMIMRGRELVEKHCIAIPAGMALDDNGLPCKTAE